MVFFVFAVPVVRFERIIYRRNPGGDSRKEYITMVEVFFFRSKYQLDVNLSAEEGTRGGFHLRHVWYRFMHAAALSLPGRPLAGCCSMRPVLAWR